MTEVRDPDDALRRCIVLIEKRALFRDCLMQCLGTATDCDLAAVASVSAWRDVADKITPAMFVLSVPDSSWHDQDTNDLDQLIQLNLGVPIIVLTASVDPANVVKALKSGAKGYIPANMPLDIALAAIRFVSAGGTFVPAAVMLEDNSARDQVPVPSTSFTMFTERQAAVMEGLRKGKANKMIAYELNMCESTVKVHVRKIMRKLKATNRTEVAYLANELFNR